MINIMLKTKKNLITLKRKKYLLLSLKTDNKKKTDSKKIRGVTLVNEIATQRSLCTHCSSKKSTF